MDNVTALKELSVKLTGGASASNIIADQIKYIADHTDTKRADAQADSAAADVPGLVADFNSLLAKLRAAGIVAEG